MGYPVCPNRIHSSGINGPWKSLFETTKSFLGDGHRLKLFFGVWESGERVKMPTQNLLRLLLLLMLMLRIMLATVCYRFGPKAKLLFRPWAQGLAQIWSWSSGKILKLEFVQYFAADIL